jgi:hypothetical protein
MLRRETGGLAQIEELIEQAVSEFPTRPVFRCALACLHADLLHADRARDLLHEFAPDDFGAIQRDNEFLFSLGFLAETAHTWDDAVRHLEAAMVQNGAMGARPWVAHTQHDYGTMLLAHGDRADADRAHALLASARGEYEALGMTPWVSRVRAP